jgi:L-asparaginase / beta-aspartyl-peptidase
VNKIALAIHGGAGTILRSSMTPELEAEYRSGLETALRIGWDILDRGGSSMDAVEAAVTSLEDFPLFNAGRGSVFTHDGKNEMDAAIMDGDKLRAGAIAFVKNVKNPIRLARLVMQHTEHILLAGEGANQFAVQMNVEMADDAYFFTEHRYEQLLRAREEGVIQLDHTAEEQDIIEEAVEHPPAGVLSTAETLAGVTKLGVGSPHVNKGTDGDGTSSTTQVDASADPQSAVRSPHSKGTVGAVACDRDGKLAAATSTGGMTNKKFGRIGDTALIGLGTYADETCAVSCTGHGEYFMLGVTAFDVAARMKYKYLSLQYAANETIARLTSIRGEGGLIAVDAKGNVALPFNSDGMYCGSVTSDGRMVVSIYQN